MQEKLIIYLKELISEYECIILPDFGGLETEKLPAKIDKIKGKIIPPSKVIKFKEEYKKDNGIIAKYISLKENCSIDKAYEILKNFIENIKNEINEKGEYTLKDIGKFKKFGDKIFFFQEENELFLKESFGLISIDFKEKEEQIDYIKENKNIEVQKQFSNNTNKKVKNYDNKKPTFWIITIILLIIIIICLLIIFYKLKNTTLPNEIVIGNNTTSQTNISPKKQEINNFLNANNIKTDSTYYIVAGSYHYLKYAEDLYKDLIKKGFNPNIIFTKEKIYRVVIGNFINKEEAIKNINLLQQKSMLHLWILPLSYSPEKIK